MEKSQLLMNIWDHKLSITVSILGLQNQEGSQPINYSYVK